uniref:(California timema) hypothetical protein n=1 Tax=Timema californicum TaxID=61474 RepID=A0A7R9J821_TIMCA|nr:unnamed protein product [Timema californicum]
MLLALRELQWYQHAEDLYDKKNSQIRLFGNWAEPQVMGNARMYQDLLRVTPYYLSTRGIWVSMGKSYHLDRCTHCICQNGTSVCRRTACPVLECPPEKQLTTPGHCCPHCPLRWEKEFKTTCTVGGHTYEASTQFTHVDFYY